MSFHKANTDSIPQGWIATPLTDLVVTKAGNSKLIKGKMHHESARNLFQGYSASGADVWSDSFEYDADGVVVSAVGARCGKSFLAKGKWVAVANTHVVLPFEDAIDPKFLWYGINDEDFWIKSGTAQPFVVVSKSFERLFAIPPRAEQTRIVAKLEELFSDLDTGVAELKAAQKKLGQYRQSLLKAAVEGALTAEWRTKHKPLETGAQLLARILTERRARWEAKQLAKFAEQGKSPPKDWQDKYPEPVQPDTTDLPELPEGWVWASVDQVAEVFLGKMLDKTKHTSGKKMSYLRNVNVRWGSIETHDLSEMFFDNHEYERYGLVSGDVLVCEGGEPGRAAMCTKEHEFLKYQKALHRVRLFGMYQPELLVVFLEHVARIGRLDKTFTGSTINHLTKESFLTLCIPIAPLAEQKAIVASLSETMASVTDQNLSIELSLKQSNAQRQNILRAAFAGELVPQDPNDEPASVLLERIRAERASQAASKKPRGRKAKGAA